MPQDLLGSAPPLAFASGGNYLLAADLTLIHVWDLRADRQLPDIDLRGGEIQFLACGQGGNSGLAVDAAGCLSVFEIPGGAVTGQCPPNKFDRIASFSADGQLLVTTRRVRATQRRWRFQAAYLAAEGSPFEAVALTGADYYQPGQVLAVACHPVKNLAAILISPADGSRTDAEPPRVELRKLDSGEIDGKYFVPAGSTSIAFSQGGTNLLVAGDSFVYDLDARTGEERFRRAIPVEGSEAGTELSFGRAGRMNSPCFSGDGKWIAAASAATPESVYVWDFPAAAHIYRLRGPAGAPELERRLLAGNAIAGHMQPARACRAPEP